MSLSAKGCGTAIALSRIAADGCATPLLAPPKKPWLKPLGNHCFLVFTGELNRLSQVHRRPYQVALAGR